MSPWELISPRRIACGARRHCHGLRRQHAFDDRRQLEKERKVQRGVDARHVARIERIAADEVGDLLLAVVDLAEGEEVLLAQAERVFTDRVAEHLRISGSTT